MLTELEVAALVFALGHFKEILSRWYLWLSQYLPNVTLEHKPGSVNKTADTFSNTPVGKAVNTQTSESQLYFRLQLR